MCVREAFRSWDGFFYFSFLFFFFFSLNFPSLLNPSLFFSLGAQGNSVLFFSPSCQWCIITTQVHCFNTCFCRLLVISGTSLFFKIQTGRGQCCIFVLKSYTWRAFPWSTEGRWCCPACPSQLYSGSQHPASLLGYCKVIFQLKPKYCMFWNTV